MRKSSLNMTVAVFAIAALTAATASAGNSDQISTDGLTLVEQKLLRKLVVTDWVAVDITGALATHAKQIGSDVDTRSISSLFDDEQRTPGQIADMLLDQDCLEFVKNDAAYTVIDSGYEEALRHVKSMIGKSLAAALEQYVDTGVFDITRASKKARTRLINFVQDDFEGDTTNTAADADTHESVRTPERELTAAE